MLNYIFFLIAAIAVISAIIVILHKNPVISALFLVLTMFCIAVIFVLLDAEFIAAIQILVYTGAIMVLFLFIIMMLNLRKDDLPIIGGLFTRKTFAISFAVVLLLEVFIIIFSTQIADSYKIKPAPFESNIESIGTELFTKYLIPFELISILLLVAIIGAVIIGKRKGEKK
jgi:NADH-quinone oxidoreductase subunit J